jgi:hypothetical protein
MLYNVGTWRWSTWRPNKATRLLYYIMLYEYYIMLYNVGTWRWSIWRPNTATRSLSTASPAASSSTPGGTWTAPRPLYRRVTVIVFIIIIIIIIIIIANDYRDHFFDAGEQEQR